MIEPEYSIIAYLVASILFISGLKGLTHPRTAVRGNLMGASGMLLATITVLLSQWDHLGLSWELIVGGIALGGFIGLLLAVKIKMTSMAELVAVFNGFGGIASMLVAAAEVVPNYLKYDGQAVGTASVSAAAIIGAVTFTGSLVAFAKLQGIISGNAIITNLDQSAL